MQTITITADSKMTLDAKQADTTYVIAAGVSLTSSTGIGIDAGSAAKGRNIIVNGSVEASGSFDSGIIIGVDAGKNHSKHLGGGDLTIGAQGSVKGGAYGINLEGDDQTMESAGTVTGHVALAAVGRNVVVENSGTIQGTFDGVDLSGDDARLHNTGSLLGANVGLGMYGDNAHVVNAGTIHGDDGGIDMTAARARLINHGTISGGDGVQMFAVSKSDSSQVIVNDGMISGTKHSIHGGDNAETVHNHGTLTGDVDLEAGNDTFDGRKGTVNGAVHGGKGDDLYVVDDGAISLSEAKNEGMDTVRSSVEFTLSANIEALVLTGKANIDGIGNDSDNTITGNAGDNSLFGGGGDDTFVFRSGAGRDLIDDFDLSGQHHDLIDVSHFAGLESFADLKGHMSEISGNAVIDFGHGDTVTLVGIDFHALRAGDFEF